ncbi:MAG: glycosyltransferase [Candidatus Hodarchaeota archaeon]
MTPPENKLKIAGITLVKNEDLYIERVLTNVLDFCDEIKVIDNESTDNTYTIAKELAEKNEKIQLFKLEDKDLIRSHKLFVEEYANTNTWVFSVDGDEIYDPKGLKKLKPEILSGKYQKFFRIRAHVLHCVKLDLETNVAKGYMAPPSRPLSNLYNFSILESWEEERNQKFIGTNKVFKNGFKVSDEFRFYNEFNWDNTIFRLLHTCFLRRSSVQRTATRTNVGEKFSGRTKRWKRFFQNLSDGRISFSSPYKLRNYKKGTLVTKDVKEFFI